MAEPTPAADRLEQAGERVRETADSGIERARAVLEFELIPFGDLHVTVGGLVAAVLAVVVFSFASAGLRYALNRYGASHTNVSRPALYTLSRVAHYVLLALGILLAMDLAGVPIGKFSLFAGALGVGLGFGLQAIFSNFVSGLILLFDRSLKVGDFVEIGADVRGTVRDIHIRATRITTNDNIDILVPNSEFVTGRVVNWTHRDVVRRLRVSFGVAYGVDKELVKKAALAAAGRVPFTLAMEGPRRPQVWLVNFGDSAVEYVLAVWLTEEATKRNAAAKAAYLWELDTSFKQHGIQIPFPQRDLNLRSVFGLSGEEAIALLRGTAGIEPAMPGTACRRTPSELPPDERAALSRNDARLDTEQGIQDAVDTPPPSESDQTPVAPDPKRDP